MSHQRLSFMPLLLAIVGLCLAVSGFAPVAAGQAPCRLQISLDRATVPPSVDSTPTPGRRRHTALQHQAGLSQPLSTFGQIEYKGWVGVGNPPQFIRVLFDTGSDLTWVPGMGCRSRGPHVHNCGVAADADARLYAPQNSSSAERTKYGFTCDYALGQAKGRYYRDYFTFGNHDSPELQLRDKVLIGVGQEMRETDDGVLGLSLAPTDGEIGTNIFAEAAREGLFERPIFTLHLGRCERASCESAGQITFGDEDRVHCGEVEGWAAVTPNSPLWKFEVDQVRVDGFHYKGRTLAMTDSGTSLILTDPRSARRLAATLGLNAWNPVLPCNTTQRMQMEFRIGAIHLRLELADLLLPLKPGGATCRLAVHAMDDETVNPADSVWVLGDPFMRAYCVVHDAGQRRVGFASAKKQFK